MVTCRREVFSFEQGTNPLKTNLSLIAEFFQESVNSGGGILKVMSLFF